MMPKQMKAFTKLAFYFLFFVIGISFSSVAQTNTFSPQIRRASAEKMDGYRANKDFMYEKDYRPSAGFFQKLMRWIGDYLFRPLGKNTSITLWDVILFAIAIAAVVLAIYYFIKNDKVGIFSRKSGASTFDITTEHEDIHQIDFERIIAEAISNLQYRTAIRYLYLKSLRDLSLKGFIIWKADKTNRDYINEMRLPDFEKPFKEVTFLFDYSWYGNVEINESSFQQIKSAFDKFNIQIQSRS